MEYAEETQMAEVAPRTGWTARSIRRRDHILGPESAGITLVEYGSYACPYCRAANEHIVEARGALGDRLRYVFRHKPLTGSDIARRAAELAELAPDNEAFWRAHETLMTRSATLTEDDLAVVAAELDARRRQGGAAPRPAPASRPTSGAPRRAGCWSRRPST